MDSLVIRNGHQRHFVVHLEEDFVVLEWHYAMQRGDTATHEWMQDGEIVNGVEMLE
jgi:hypothetical protein